MGSKTIKKALALAICAVLLVTATVFTTIAYLTSQDTVTNTFTIGNVKITLDEAAVDAYGVAIKPVAPATSVPRVNANEYKLIPGHSYTKDPTIHVAAGSEDCWLFVKLENGLADAEAAGTTTIAAQMTANGWKLIDSTNNVYARTGAKGTAGTDAAVFANFTLNSTVKPTDYEDAEIVVTAYAIQADGFATAEDAWTAAGAGLLAAD